MHRLPSATSHRPATASLPRGAWRLGGASVAAALVALASCAPEPEVATRVVTLHAPAACPVPSGAYALLYPAGDFPLPAQPYQVFRPDGEALDGMPASVRQLELDVSAGDLRFRGFGLVPPSGPIDLMAWPDGAGCALSGGVGGPARSAHQLTVSGSFVLVSGGVEPDRSPQSFLADLRTGEVRPLPIDGDLRTQRARAAAAAFPGGVMVSGGVRGDGSLLDSAERLTLGDRAQVFDAVVPLGSPRADHAAVTLASGEVLLVGGTGGRSLIRELELVDPKTGRARTAGLAQLAVPRRHPRVLRLASGEILVAGGFDENDVPVRRVEWFTRDAAAAAKPPRDIDVGKEQGIVPLPAGGALVVTTQAPPLEGASVIVVSASGEIETAPSIQGKVSRVALFEAAGGAPVLFTGDRWLRFRPWEGDFVALPLAAPGGLVPGPREGSVVGTADAGLFVWTEAGRLVGLRLAPLRGPYTSEGRALLTAGTPEPFVPDGLVTNSSLATLRYDSRAGLTLPAGARVVVADATFAAFEARIEVETAGAFPEVALRGAAGAEVRVGGAACPWPEGAAVVSTVTVARRGARAVVGAGDQARSCDLPALRDERVTLGLRGTVDAPVVVRSVDIARRP